MLKRTLVEAGLSRAKRRENAKFSTYRPAILFALAGFLSLVCAQSDQGVDPRFTSVRDAPPRQVVNRT